MTFDLSLTAHYGLTVHAFDPTPKSIAWLQAQQVPPTFQFYPWGLADFDGTASFAAPENPEHVSYSLLPLENRPTVDAEVYRLSTLMRRVGHAYIDVLKMDIEGAEYAVIRDLLEHQLDVRQILVEFHHRFDGNGIEQTKEAIRLLNAHGYRIFYVSPHGEEYSFIRL